MFFPDTIICVSPNLPFPILPPFAIASWQVPLPCISPCGLQVDGALKWKNPYTDHYIQNSIDSEYVLHCSNSGYPSSKLNNSQAAGYIFITNVSGSPKTMRLAMRWDNDYSGNWSQRYSRNDITTP